VKTGTPLHKMVKQYVKLLPGDKPIPGVSDYDALYRVTHSYQNSLELGLCLADDNYDVFNNVVKYIVPVDRTQLTYKGVRPDIGTLLLASDAELDEMLLDVNTPNTRQLLRIALGQIKQYRNDALYLEEKLKDVDRKHDYILGVLEGAIDIDY
jgi:hypothetical protein